MPINQTLAGLVSTAIWLSGKEFDNADARVESMVPFVFYEVSRRYAVDPKRRPLTLAIFSLSFTNGVATLPVAVLTEFLEFGVMANAGDATQTKKFRYVSWTEFTRPLDSTLGYFSVNTETNTSVNTKIYVTLPGAAYIPGAGLTGTLTLTTPAAVAVPTVESNPVLAPQEIQSDIILALGRALSGKWLTEETTT